MPSRMELSVGGTGFCRFLAASGTFQSRVEYKTMEPAAATITNAMETPNSNLLLGGAVFLSKFMDGKQIAAQFHHSENIFACVLMIPRIVANLANRQGRGRHA